MSDCLFDLSVNLIPPIPSIAIEPQTFDEPLTPGVGHTDSSMSHGNHRRGLRADRSPVSEKDLSSAASDAEKSGRCRQYDAGMFSPRLHEHADFSRRM